MNGYIKLHRQLMKSHIWTNSTPLQRSLLITILLLANHAEAEVEINETVYKLQPGQFITSVDKLKDKAGKGATTQQVRTALKRFKRLEFLTIKTTNKFSIITICKYETYQGNKKPANKQNNKGLTTNKNDKEIYKGKFKNNSNQVLDLSALKLKR